jgi:hypothetical protein
MEEMTTREFSVFQWFVDGQYERYVHHVDLETASKKAVHLATSVGATLGTTVRVIITDGGDCIIAEWKKGEGFVFPPDLAEAIKGKAHDPS